MKMRKILMTTVCLMAFAAAVGFLWTGVARAEAPRAGVTRAGIYNKVKGWMNEDSEICRFDPIDVKAILRVCGEGPCTVIGSVVNCPVMCLKMTNITSIKRAKLEDVGGVELLNAPGLEHLKKAK